MVELDFSFGDAQNHLNKTNSMVCKAALCLAPFVSVTEVPGDLDVLAHLFLGQRVPGEIGGRLSL